MIIPLTYLEDNSPAVIGVSIYPGTITFDLTITPLSFNKPAASTANERVNPNRPALEAAYGTAPVPSLCASSEEILIMHFDFSSAELRPRFAILVRIKARIIAREVVMEPSRLVCRVSEISAGSMRGRILVFAMPAALIRMSTFALLYYQISGLSGVSLVWLGVLTISLSNSRVHEPDADTSPTNRLTFFPASIIAGFWSSSGVLCLPGRSGSPNLFAALASRSYDRPTRMTLSAPSCRKRSAIAYPIPDVPPVIMHVRLERRAAVGNWVCGLGLGGEVYGLALESACRVIDCWNCMQHLGSCWHVAAAAAERRRGWRD